MAQRDQFAVGRTRLQPKHELVQRRVVVITAPPQGPLVRPALELAREVVARAAVVGEADRGDVEPMDRGHRTRHGVVDGAALPACDPRRCVFGEDAAFHPFHQIEGRAQHCPLGAVVQRLGHRHFGVSQRGQHAELAVDGVRRWHDLAGRLLAQHRLPNRRGAGSKWGWTCHPRCAVPVAARQCYRTGRAGSRRAARRRNRCPARFADFRSHQPPCHAYYARALLDAGAAFFRPKPNRYCATRRICTSSLPSVIR